MGYVPARRPGWSLDPERKFGARGMVAHPRKGWTEPGLQALWQIFRMLWRLAGSATTHGTRWQARRDRIIGDFRAGGHTARRATRCGCVSATVTAAARPATGRRRNRPTAPS